jgi:hypothetical protein
MRMTRANAVEIQELSVGETHLAHQAMRALRTAYESEQEFDAHRLYYNHRLAIHSHHFARGV